MSNYIVGLTGGIGSGKSTVADLFAEHGIAIVDTDAIAHELTTPGGAAMPALREAFGDTVAGADGALDRGAMRQKVFADPGARARLESVLHPMIARLSIERCAAAASPYVILAVPLLIESGAYRARCQRVLVVDCDEATQVARVSARSGLADAEARAIMATQVSRAERLAAADDLIVNNDGPDALVPKVAALHRQYLDFSAKFIKNL